MKILYKIKSHLTNRCTGKQEAGGIATFPSRFNTVIVTKFVVRSLVSSEFKRYVLGMSVMPK